LCEVFLPHTKAKRRKLVFLENEIRIYYGGSDWHHDNWRNAFLCLATLRPDGFACYEPEGADKTATISTKPVAVVGGSLCLSADVAKSGHVKVTVLDKENKVLAESDPITETGTDIKMKWTEKFSLEKLTGREIKFRFELKGAKLYSFSFED